LCDRPPHYWGAGAAGPRYDNTSENAQFGQPALVQAASQNNLWKRSLQIWLAKSETSN
jgi:hypothetical protein